MNDNLISFCKENGFLLDKELINLFSNCEDFEAIKIFLQKLNFNFKTRIFSINLLNKENEKLKRSYFELPLSYKEKLNFLKSSFNFESNLANPVKEEISIQNNDSNVSVLTNYPALNKKVEC
jgi:hypothetical protein